MTLEQQLREALAKGLWDSLRAEGEAEGPVDSARQPYCQSTYRQADKLLPIVQAAIAAELKAAARIAELRAKEYQGELDARIPSANWRSSITSLRNETEWIQHEIEARIQPAAESALEGTLREAEASGYDRGVIEHAVVAKRDCAEYVDRERAKARAEAYRRCRNKVCGYCEADYPMKDDPVRAANGIHEHFKEGMYFRCRGWLFEQWALAEEAKSAGASEGK